MLRILSAFVIFHWAALYSVLAFLCVLSGDDGATQALRLLGVTIGENPAFPVLAPAATALLSLLFAISAVLFWWALLTSVFSSEAGAGRRDHDVVVMAFASASAALTAVFLYGAAQGFAGLCLSVSAHLCALLASYAAVFMSGSAALDRAGGRERDRIGAVRMRPTETSGVVSLIRFPIRPTPVRGEAKP